MRGSIILLLTMMIFIGCHSGNDEVTNAEKAGLISGTENPKIKKCQNGTAYIFKEYEIKVELSPERQGMNIFLYAPETSDGNPCDIDKKKASHIIGTGETEGNNFFAGVYKSYLFIDRRTGPDHRTLSVYDLTQKKLILLTEYSDPKLQDGVLTYYKTLVPDPGVIENIPCPDAEKWREQAHIVLYEQKENFTLNTERRLPIREYRCRSGQ
ncbi:MAG: hypothetical protein O6830_05060 [Candidatus Dadabacteria bacterium]|nr:hypothetical protein [Candidatus Dadabacteria bacterium]